MAILMGGATRDEDFVEYARLRLAAYLQAAGIAARAIRLQNDDGSLFLGVFFINVEEADVANIPRSVDGLRVEII